MTEYIIKFEKRLKSIFSEETDTFKSLLNETGAVVSGSIIVQAILGEEWKSSDIDIYIPATDEQSPHGNPTSKIDEWLLNKLGWKMSNYMAINLYGDTMSRGQDITWIRNFNSNNLAIPRVQLIHTRLKSNELTEYINTNFDFVICKNVYSVNADSALLFINNVSAIVKKQFSFEFAGNIFGSLERAKKYIDRGFKITFDSLKILDEILAFQENQRYLDDSKKKSNIYVRICKKDISLYDCRVFYIWMKNIEDYDIRDSELIKQGTAETSKTKKFCDEHCFMSLLGFKHFHTQGKHHGHANCEDLIVMNK